MKPSRRSKSRNVALPPLTDIQRQVMSYILTSIAFKTFDNVSSVDVLAEYFHRSPARFMSTLRKLAEKGYVSIQGDAYQWVVPTVAALQQQDPRLSDADAKAILKGSSDDERRRRDE
jgi:hypothetical protein